MEFSDKLDMTMKKEVNKTAVVTGAGSGVGRATVLKLAAQGWRVALMGRRISALEETLSLVAADRGAQPTPSPCCKCYPCDVGNSVEVTAVAGRILEEFESVDLLVNSAGTNTQERALEVLSLENFHALMNANLNGAYYCSQAFLPHFRERGMGTIVHVVSEAGRQASPKAGPAYVMSKFGMAGLSQSINAEERGRGIRSCAIFPGDIDTPLLERRPVVPDAAARERMLRSEDVADCIVFCAQLPTHVVVEELLVRPR